MIELVRSRLDAREQARWRAALAQEPIVARPSARIDPALATVAASLWAVPLLLTFETWPTMPSPLVVAIVRCATAACLVWSVRRAIWSWRARASEWPSGRFLFRWGYVEIEHDRLRVVPTEVLDHDLRGRFLGIGPITLRLRADAWSTRLVIDLSQLEAVVTALQDGRSTRVGLLTDGYRVAATRTEGPRARRRLPHPIREATWALAGVIVSAAVPVTGSDGEAPHASDLREPYAAALRTDGDKPFDAAIAFDLAGCSTGRAVVTAAANHVRMGLAGHPILPVFPRPLGERRRAYADARIWADCVWESDPETQMHLRARARWGLDREGVNVIEREGVVEAADAIRLIDECHLGARGTTFSAEGLVAASLRLLEGAIREDLHSDLERETNTALATLTGACIRRHAAAVTIFRVRDP